MRCKAEDNLVTVELEMTDEEENALFRQGLRLLLGNAYKVLSIHEHNKHFDTTDTRKVEISEEDYEYIMNIAVVDVLEKVVKK